MVNKQGEPHNCPSLPPRSFPDHSTRTGNPGGTPETNLSWEDGAENLGRPRQLEPGKAKTVYSTGGKKAAQRKRPAGDPLSIQLSTSWVMKKIQLRSQWYNTFPLRLGKKQGYPFIPLPFNMLLEVPNSTVRQQLECQGRR